MPCGVLTSFEVYFMEYPVFKLEGVVHTRADAEEMTDFEGPLDLILYLLSKNKIEIQDISISLILDQYLAYLEARKQLDLDIASEFVTMASHLMFIKTRMLLSLEDEEAKSEMEELIHSLEERKNKDTYLCVKAVLPQMETMAEFGRNIMTRPREPMSFGKVITYDQSAEDLRQTFAVLAMREERLAAPKVEVFREIVRQEPYPVENKMKDILHRLKKGGVTRFLQLFRGSRTRSEVVATFMAVLELCRDRKVRLAGKDGDCTVERAD